MSIQVIKRILRHKQFKIINHKIINKNKMIFKIQPTLSTKFLNKSKKKIKNKASKILYNIKFYLKIKFLPIATY